MVRRSRHNVQGDADSRTLFDSEYCTDAKGYARILTTRDAWYYGQWLDPWRRQIVTYTEGDLEVIDCDTDRELKTQLERLADFHRKDGTWIGIEAASPTVRRRCAEAGLDALVHERDGWNAAGAASTPSARARATEPAGVQP